MNVKLQINRWKAVQISLAAIGWDKYSSLNWAQPITKTHAYTHPPTHTYKQTYTLTPTHTHIYIHTHTSFLVMELLIRTRSCLFLSALLTYILVSSADLSLVQWSLDRSVHLNMILSWYLLPVPPLGRTAPSRWFATRQGIARNSLSLELRLFPRTSSLALFSHPRTAPFSRSRVGGATKSFLEGTLCKCPTWITHKLLRINLSKHEPLCRGYWRDTSQNCVETPASEANQHFRLWRHNQL